MVSKCIDVTTMWFIWKVSKLLRWWITGYRICCSTVSSKCIESCLDMIVISTNSIIMKVGLKMGSRVEKDMKTIRMGSGI